MEDHTFISRIERFRNSLSGNADLAFLPISADLQFLAGIPREFPTYGAIMHPGAWLEGMWLTPDQGPLLSLTRMTVEFNNPQIAGVELRVLGDWDDPMVLVQDVLRGFHLTDDVCVALGDRTQAGTYLNLNHLLPGARYTSATRLLRQQRMIKDDTELAFMRRAGEVTETAFQAVLTVLKHGMTELEVISELDYQLRCCGGFGPSFNSSIYCVGPAHPLVFGQHGGTWQRPLHPPVALMFDFGAIYQGYCYDFGRTVVFGTPDADFLRVHELVMASQAAGIQSMRAGSVTAADVDAAARQVIEKAGMGDAFRHRLGHGIGLDVHEPPFLTQGDESILRSGMLFTVEPSIIFEDRCSARVEDVVLVTPDGGSPLTRGFQELIVID